MQYILGGLVIMFLAALVVGAALGRVKIQSCCSVADPARDLRMRQSGTTAADADPDGHARDSAGVQGPATPPVWSR